MAYRKVTQFEQTGLICTLKTVVQYNPEWQEYRVRIYRNNVLLPDCDYFDTDKESAIKTAEMILKQTIIKY